MQKLVLKKDLPFAKAGEEVNLIGNFLKVFNNGRPSYIGEVDDLDMLIKEGWIEKIKEENKVKLKLKLVFCSDKNVAEVFQYIDGKLVEFNIKDFYPKILDVELSEYIKF